MQTMTLLNPFALAPREHLRAVLTKIGFHDCWLACGLIAPGWLEVCAEVWQLERGPPEQYRFAAFLSILQSHSALSDAQVCAFVQLIDQEPDRAVAGSALKALVEWPRLSHRQLAWLTCHLWSEPNRLNVTIQRTHAARDPR